MADVPQRLDLGLGKADPEEYFRRLALYSYAVAPLFPGRKQEGQYVPGLRQYAAGGRILEDEFPSAYMPGVGRQVMAGGGRSIEKALELARSIITSAPEKSVNAYKLFRKKDDQLYPLFVNANTPVPMGEWLAAQSGPMVGEKVKSSLGPLAYRPGWHAGDLPIATHIGGKSAPGLNAPDYRPDNQVWAEIAMPDDVDWQTEALRRAQLNKRGEIIPRTAHITDQVPVGGYYRYKTNPNMTGDWMIGGSMRVNRILPDEEVMEINRARGVSDLPRLEDILKRQGMQDGGAPQPGDEASQFVRGQLSLPTAAEQARIDEILRPSPLMEQYGGYGTTQAIKQNVARPMPTSSEFVQHQLRGNEPQLPQMDREAYNTMKELSVAPLSLAAYNIPVAGQILGAVDLARGLRDVGQAVQSGDKGDIAAGIGEAAMASTGVKGKLAKTAAAAMAGMMPEDAQAMFFGESAKLTPQLRSALEAAKRALVGGAKPAETWQKYGFAPDPAGKMVGEISDAAARLNPAGLQKFRSGEQMTLGEILSHPDYYDLYPSMYTAKLNPVTPNDERVRGYYNQLTDTLHASTRLDDRALLANLLHEPTHRMQLIEGMSPGSDPRHFTNPFVKSTEDREDLASLYGSEVIRDFMNKNPNIDRYEAAKFLREQKVPIGPQPTKFLGLTPEAADETKKLLQSRIEDTFRRYPDPNYQYKMSLGEVAARAPGERLEMSEAARRAAFPFADENIIVRPPHPTRLQNVASPEWERDRAQALELSRQLQREPLPPEIPSKFSIETTDAEEELMRIAQALEAQKRAGKAFVAGAAPAKDKGGAVVKSALKMLGKLMPEGSGYAGVPGKPSLVNLPGIGKVEARPIPEIESAASKYMQSTGRPGEHEIASFPEFNPAFATKVAEAFAEMKHRPGDPAVRRAYDALIDETMAQYRAAKDTGIDFRFLKEGQQDPYAASPALGYEDIVNRGRLFVFPTEQGFGSSGGLIADNPLLKRAGQVGDKPDAVINDAFRIVHDLYGHFGPGNPFFRAPGEERAYQLHSRMFGKEALPAATLETRGQNSWLNYGPYGEANRSALGADTHFAEQKIGRMPEWTQAPAPAVGADVEEYIRSLTGKAEGGEVAQAEPDMVSRALGFLSQFNPVGTAQAETLPGVVAKALARKIVPTVKNLAREEPLFPGVYGNPREMAKEAESRVAPEDPIMKQLFGVTRQDVFDIAARRPGNAPPVIKAPPERTRGVNYASEGVMTPENERRLIDILAEGEKQPGLRTGMMPWYYMDPVYTRMEQMFGPEEAAKRYNIFNTTLGSMSPGSPVQTEINRGLGAYHLATQGRLEDFLTYGGKPSAAPEGTLPSYVREAMLGHPYHSTSQAGPLKRFFETGEYTTGTPKVPLYIQASGVPETGFQTTLPVPDAHYTRILGMPDVRKTGDPGTSMKMGEYRPIGPWFRESVAKPAEMEAVPAQALLWGTGSGATGVDTPIGSPKLEMLSQEIANIARRRGVTPETARDLVLQGKLYAEGGSVIDDAIRVSSDVANARELEAV